MSKTSQAAMEILADRLEGLMDRLKQVEQWCAQKPTFAIDLRFTLLEQHIKQLETRLGVSYSSADSAGLLAGALHATIMLEACLCSSAK